MLLARLAQNHLVKPQHCVYRRSDFVAHAREERRLRLVRAVGDGTLFLETAPTYFDWMLFEHRVLDDSTYKPSKKQLKAARDGREKRIFPGLSAERERMVAEAYKGMTLSEFEAYVRAFMQEPQPGFTGLKRGEAYYKPMVEVVKFLTANGFTVYVSEQRYGTLYNAPGRC